MALILSIMLTATMLAVPAINASAEVMDLTDYVPVEDGTMLDGQVIKITSYNGANYDYGIEIKELDDNISEFYAKDTRKTVPSSVSRPAGGLEYSVAKDRVKKGDKLVFVVKIRKVNEDDVIPNLVIGLVDAAMGGSAAGWGWKGQTVYAHDITSTEWQTIVQEITVPYDGTASTKAVLGLGAGCTHDAYKNRTDEVDWRPGAAVEIDMSSVYLGKLTAYDINFELSYAEIAIGETITGNASIVDRIGGTEGYDQSFTYHVTDSEGNTVEGFEVEVPAEGEVTIKAGSTVLPGEYVVLAVSDVYPGFKKTFPISVTYGAVSKEDGTKIVLTSTKDVVGVTNIPVITATVEKNGSAVAHTEPIVWTAITSDKMSVCEDIDITVSEDTMSAELGLALSIAEGSYYIMATSDGMCALYEITVDKSGDIENIASKIEDKEIDEIVENMETYLAVLELSDTIVAAADEEMLANVVADSVAEDEAEVLDIAALKNYFTDAAIVTFYEKNESDLALYDDNGMFIYADELELAEMDKEVGVNLWELYGDEEKVLLSTEGRLDMQSALADDAPYATIGQFKSKVAESILLYTLAYPNVNSFGYVSDILTEENLAYVDIDGSDYLALSDKTKANESVAGTLYTADELEEALKNASEEDDEEEEEEDSKDKYKPSGTGSLGSFGGGGGGSSKSEPKEEPKDEEAKEQEPVSSVEVKFADIPDNHWACTDIYFLREIGVVNGTTETEFNPNGLVTREQFLKMLVTAFKLSGSADKAFTDVSADAWYAPYVNAGVGSGVVNGLPDGRFGVGSSITRQDACVMLARSLGLDTSVEVDLSFTDAESISSYAANSVGALVEYAIISGYDDNTFKAGATCTRAQAAKLVANAITIFNSIQQGGSN